MKCKVKVGSDDIGFNNLSSVDSILLNGQLILLFLDEARHFIAAKGVNRQTASKIWNVMMYCWHKVYLGTIDYLYVDKCFNYM